MGIAGHEGKSGELKRLAVIGLIIRRVHIVGPVVGPELSSSADSIGTAKRLGNAVDGEGNIVFGFKIVVARNRIGITLFQKAFRTGGIRKRRGNPQYYK